MKSRQYPRWQFIADLKHQDTEDLVVTEAELRKSLVEVPSKMTASLLTTVRRELKRRNQKKVAIARDRL